MDIQKNRSNKIETKTIKCRGPGTAVNEKRVDDKKKEKTEIFWSS